MNITALIIYPLLTTTLFYLGSRAIITSFIWKRYPIWLMSFMDCSACAGTWWGLLVGIFGGYWLDLNFLDLDGKNVTTLITIALCSTTWTTIGAALVQHSFFSLGSKEFFEENTILEEKENKDV